MPTSTPPYQFIAIARTIARGFTEQTVGRPDWELEALTKAAQAIWRGIEVLEGMIGANGRALPDRCGPCGGRCQRHRFQLAD